MRAKGHSEGPWHVVVVTDNEEPGDEYTFDYVVMHPECPVRWSSREGVTYECDVMYQVEMIGLKEVLLGIENSGWYRVRIVHETLRGADWVEYDSHTEIESLNCWDHVHA